MRLEAVEAWHAPIVVSISGVLDMIQILDRNMYWLSAHNKLGKVIQIGKRLSSSGIAFKATDLRIYVNV